jgi:hypothetical protein
MTLDFEKTLFIEAAIANTTNKQTTTKQHISWVK